MVIVVASSVLAPAALADNARQDSGVTKVSLNPGSLAAPVQVRSDIWDLLEGQAGSKGALGYARSALPTIIPPIDKAAKAASAIQEPAAGVIHYQSATLDFLSVLDDLEARQPLAWPNGVTQPTELASLDSEVLVPASDPIGRQPATLDPAVARALVLDEAGQGPLSQVSGRPGRAAVAALSSRLAQSRTQLQSYRRKLASLGQAVSVSEDQMATLEADKRNLTGQLAATQAQIERQLLPDLRAARAGLLSLNAEHRALIAAHEQARTALDAAERRIADELEPQIAALKEREGTQVGSLFERLDALGLERDIAIFQARQTAVAMEEMGGQLDRELRPKVVDLSRQLASLGAERDTLIRTVQSLSQAINAEYRPKLVALESENVALQNRNTKLANQITRLEQDLRRRAQQVKAKQGHVDPARCEALVNQKAVQLEAMTGLLAMFQLEQIAPKDLRAVTGDEASAFDFVFNDLAAGWMLERRVDPFISPDEQKMALLDSKSKKRRWSPQGSDNVLALQEASNSWLKRRGLTLNKIGLPAAKGCSGRLCLTGVVDKRTRIVASYIFDRDPSAFPGAAAQRSAKIAAQGQGSAVATPSRVLPGALLDGLKRACQGG